MDSKKILDLVGKIEKLIPSNDSDSREELKNGLNEKLYDKAKKEFTLRLETIDWNKFYLEKPFQSSGLALYNWSPIADNLKVLDKEIVLNSIMLKWNLVENDFKDLTKNLKFN